MTVDKDALVAYALGTLSVEEAREVEAFLKTQPEEAQEVKGYLEGLTAMVMSLSPEELPADAERELLARVRGGGEMLLPEPAQVRRAPRPGPPKRALLWLGLAAAVLALVVWRVALPPPTPVTPVGREIERYAAVEGALVQPLVGADEARVGTLVRLPGDRLFMALDRPPPAGQVYQAWEIAGGVPLSLGITDEQTLLIDHEVTPGSLFGVTQEPPGGSEAPTSEPVALAEL